MSNNKCCCSSCSLWPPIAASLGPATFHCFQTTTTTTVRCVISGPIGYFKLKMRNNKHKILIKLSNSNAPIGNSPVGGGGRTKCKLASSGLHTETQPKLVRYPKLRRESIGNAISSHRISSAKVAKTLAHSQPTAATPAAAPKFHLHQSLLESRAFCCRTARAVKI